MSNNYFKNLATLAARSMGDAVSAKNISAEDVAKIAHKFDENTSFSGFPGQAESGFTDIDKDLSECGKVKEAASELPVKKVVPSLDEQNTKPSVAAIKAENTTKNKVDKDAPLSSGNLSGSK